MYSSTLISCHMNKEISVTAYISLRQKLKLYIMLDLETNVYYFLLFGYARKRKGSWGKFTFPCLVLKSKRRGKTARKTRRNVILHLIWFEFSLLFTLGIKQKKEKEYFIFLSPCSKHTRCAYSFFFFSFLTFFMYFSTSQGTCERLLKPPNAVPFQTRPVTNWKGRVLISWPEAATPTITEVPHPWSLFWQNQICLWLQQCEIATRVTNSGQLTLWQHSKADLITETFPMHSKL